MPAPPMRGAAWDSWRAKNNFFKTFSGAVFRGLSGAYFMNRSGAIHSETA